MTKRKKPEKVCQADWDAVDIPQLDAKTLARMRPARDAVPEVVAVYRRSRGRPPKENAKEQVTLRLDPEVLAYFRSQGRGWQTLLNDALSVSLAFFPDVESPIDVRCRRARFGQAQGRPVSAG